MNSTRLFHSRATAHAASSEPCPIPPRRSLGSIGTASLAAACAVALLASTLSAQTISLREAVALAQKQGYPAQAAVATRDAARARDNAFGARLLPQISLSQQATSYAFARNIQPVIQPDGSTLFTPVEQRTANAGVTLSQRVPFTGTTMSVTSSLQRYEKRGTAIQTTWSSAPVTFAITQPINRPNSMRWDGRAQDLTLEAAERQYIEGRETIAGQTSTSFFDYYVAKRTLDNAILNAATNDTLYTLNKGRLEVGKISENDLLQSELALLRSRTALENARLEHDRTLAAFRLALNLPVGAKLDVTVPSDIPQVDPDTTIAVQQALRNRAQMTDLALQEVQAKRRVSEAKLNNGLGANVTASVGLNQTGQDMTVVYQDLLQAQQFRVGVEIPLIQFGARRAEVQAARADEKRVVANSNASRAQVTQEAHFAALQLSQARRNVALSAKADTVAQKRFDVAYNRYVIGRIGVDILYTAQAEKDQAVNQYLLALRNYWAAYYRLRAVTLYDFEAGAPIR
jgi:outer membrane protein TolC